MNSLDYYMQKYMNLDRILLDDLIEIFSLKVSRNVAREIVMNAISSGFIHNAKHDFWGNRELLNIATQEKPILCDYYLDIMEVINWIEMERNIPNNNFPIVFSDEFIEHQKSRNSVLYSFLNNVKKRFIKDSVANSQQESAITNNTEHNVKLLQKESSSEKKDFFQQLAKDIIEEIKLLQFQEMINVPFVVRSCIVFCGFELSGKEIYDQNGQTVNDFSYDSLTIYVKELGISPGKLGRLSMNADYKREQVMDLLKTRFVESKYDIHRENLKKLNPKN